MKSVSRVSRKMWGSSSDGGERERMMVTYTVSLRSRRVRKKSRSLTFNKMEVLDVSISMEHRGERR